MPTQEFVKSFEKANGVNCGNPGKVTALRLDTDDLERAKAVAEQLDTNFSAVVRAALVKFLREVEPRLAAEPSLK